MFANPGDRIEAASRSDGAEPNGCQVLEALGPEGGPPYLVVWDDPEALALYFPGSRAVILPPGSR